jgi:hypothetical protein
MHNVRRPTPGALTADAIASQRAEEQRKLALYKELEGQFQEHVRNQLATLMQRARGDLNHEALDSTTSVLAVNPEYYTAWNYRRNILDKLLECSSTVEKARLIQNDMALLQQSMRAHPKVYWLWNHRRWCLHKLPTDGTSEEARQRKWREELSLVDMMLDMDARNCTYACVAHTVMGWNYRRWVIAELAATMHEADVEVPPFPVSLSSPLNPAVRTAHLKLAHDELRYTLRKIESNFSNFSAWHNRSKLLPRVWDAEKLDESAKATERIKGAFHMDV